MRPGSSPSGPCGRAERGDVLLGPVAVSVLVTVLSLPASVLGNEASIRFGWLRAITVIMFRIRRSGNRHSDAAQRCRPSCCWRWCCFTA